MPREGIYSPGGGAALSNSQSFITVDTNGGASGVYASITTLSLVSGTYLLLAIIGVTSSVSQGISARLRDQTGAVVVAVNEDNATAVLAADFLSFALAGIRVLGSTSTVGLELSGTSATVPVAKATPADFAGGANLVTAIFAIKIG